MDREPSSMMPPGLPGSTALSHQRPEEEARLGMSITLGGDGPAAGLAAGEIAETSLEARVRPRQARIAGVGVYEPMEPERAKLAALLHCEADEVEGVTPGAGMAETSQDQPATRTAPRTGEQMPCA
ncbi:uncharacterized conserved protein HEN1/CORYMBOSA2 [Moesziomyces antarcticus T-34]|uniref:Uncharacterized conserved protein HEN1/CORYMBOSA2 n=1 Tax=Pseudozyma antarctica (strain T-34) TaxID=1151754 RepID=M9MA82_PSEA3|nr:uncharacterized conserved protein HEN1/CORYMBOSA2 [Moesziomyces antarcticus T-34]